MRPGADRYQRGRSRPHRRHLAPPVPKRRRPGGWQDLAERTNSKNYPGGLRDETGVAPGAHLGPVAGPPCAVPRGRDREAHFEATEQVRLTDRYTKAIEQLGDDKLDVHLGGTNPQTARRRLRK